MRYFIIMLVLLQSTLSYAQWYKDGFVTFQNDSTLFTKVHIPFNGKSLKYIENGKKLKKLKAEFKDYGFIEKGNRKYSTYAETSFLYSSFEGLLVTDQVDTIPCYIGTWSENKVKGYYMDRTPFKFPAASNVASFSIKSYDSDRIEYESISYDRIIFEEVWKDSSPENVKFLERQVDGKIKLYYYTYTRTSALSNRIPTSKSYKVYFLVKNNKTYLIETGYNIYNLFPSKKTKARRQKREDNLKEVFADCPSILDKIKNGTFKERKLKQLLENNLD